MDFEAQRKKRMEALEDKRRRLEEMRKTRKERSEGAEEVQEHNNNQTNQSEADQRAQVDDLVNSLLVSTINEPISPSMIDLVSPNRLVRLRARVSIRFTVRVVFCLTICWLVI